MCVCLTESVSCALVVRRPCVRASAVRGCVAHICDAFWTSGPPAFRPPARTNAATSLYILHTYTSRYSSPIRAWSGICACARCGSAKSVSADIVVSPEIGTRPEHVCACVCVCGWLPPPPACGQLRSALTALTAGSDMPKPPELPKPPDWRRAVYALVRVCAYARMCDGRHSTVYSLAGVKCGGFRKNVQVSSTPPLASVHAFICINMCRHVVCASRRPSHVHDVPHIVQYTTHDYSYKTRHTPHRDDHTFSHERNY